MVHLLWMSTCLLILGRVLQTKQPLCITTMGFLKSWNQIIFLSDRQAKLSLLMIMKFVENLGYLRSQFDKDPATPN